jgi:hypothetical protein
MPFLWLNLGQYGRKVFVWPAAFVHKRTHSPYKRKEMIKKSLTSLKPFFLRPLYMKHVRDIQRLFCLKLFKKINIKIFLQLFKAQMVKVFSDCKKLNKKN